MLGFCRYPTRPPARLRTSAWLNQEQLMRTSRAAESAHEIPNFDHPVYEDDRWPFPYAAMFMVGLSAILWTLIYAAITTVIATLA